MSDDGNTQPGGRDIITPAERKKIWIWAAMILLLFVVATIISARAVYKNKAAAVERHNARMNPDKGEGGTIAPSPSLPAGANPVRVQTGVYVDRIIELSVKETKWTVDLYLWFRWKGTDVDPAANVQIVDGSIVSKVKADEYTNGDEHYVLYRVVANITKFFDVSRFPRDNHILTISLENPSYMRSELLFVPDMESSGLSSRVLVPGYSISKQLLIEKPHAYRSTHGDPRLALGTEKVQSQLRMGVWMNRQGWGFYFKMFVALFVAVGVAMLAFFIKPTEVDPRFGLGVGALGVVIVNTFVISSLVPDTGVMTLADIVNHISTVTIFLTLMQSAISLYLYERKGKKELSRFFDRVSFVAFLAGYIVINLILPWAATL